MPIDATGGGRLTVVSARDGLRLKVRCYEAPRSALPPLLCLAGLTRNSRDFHDLACALSTGRDARTVYALDARGRGLSEFDRTWKKYTVAVETHDVIDVAAALGLHGVHLLGTSRGGLIAMLLSAIQPTVMRSVVLNDIGPVIGYEGLSRIAGYVGRLPLPGSWPEATALVADMSRRMFPAVPEAQWEEVARAWFNEKDGRPARGYDPGIARTMSVHDGPLPLLWPQFEALTLTPMLALRGELSDILSPETLAEMLRRHPNAAAITVPGQGHAPLLKDPGSIGAIARFLAAVDRGEAVAGRNFASDRG